MDHGAKKQIPDRSMLGLTHNIVARSKHHNIIKGKEERKTTTMKTNQVEPEEKEEKTKTRWSRPGKPKGYHRVRRSPNPEEMKD